MNKLEMLKTIIHEYVSEILSHIHEGLKIKVTVAGFKYSGPQCSFYVNF